MHQQYPSDDQAMEPFSLSEQGVATPGKDETRVRQRGDTRQAQSSAPTQIAIMAELTHTLVEPITVEEALTHATAIGLRLLPHVTELRLLVVDETNPPTFLWEVNAAQRADQEHEQGIHTQTLNVVSDSLGLGVESDQRVLVDHQAIHSDDMWALPLLSRDRRLIGVCALRMRNRSRRQAETQLLPLLTDHLTLLLERWQRERADAASEQAWRATIEAERQGRDAFISFAAHELRSPLTSLKGYSQLLIRQARKTPLPEPMVRSVEAIEQQSVRMAEIIGELLDASRIQRGALDLMPGSADLVPLATKVVERTRPLYPQHQIALDVAAESLVGSWEPPRVEQILRDLLDNACRYSPESSSITVRVSREGDMALISVCDQGIGISAEDRQHVFEYLYRAPSAERRNLSGLGLGLYVCRYLAERLGGRLWLESSSDTPPTGSEFRVMLPLA